MLEYLKELEKEAAEHCPDHEILRDRINDDHEMNYYQTGYIDGLRTAILKLEEENTADISDYSVEMDEIFGDMYDNNNEDED